MDIKGKKPDLESRDVKKGKTDAPSAKDVELTADINEPRPKAGDDGDAVAEIPTPDAGEPAVAAKEPSPQELTDHLQRLAAEFENYKKRTAREIQHVQEFGAARVMEAVLPVLDSFDLSLTTEPAGHDAAAWRAGLEKINRQLIETLEKLGLHKVPAQKGDALDPRIHEVMLTQPSVDLPPDHVLQVFQTGYKLKDRLLRPAKVVVSATPPPTQNGETENA